MDVATRGYVKIEHPVQQRILGVLEAMTGLDLGAAPRGVDGCGIPVLGIPLGNIALAMARLGLPDDQPEARQAACRRVRRAVAAEPFMVAGSGRFDTLVMEKTGAKALIKTGAEGVYCASFPELGLGAALKVDDGAGRAAEIVMGRLLRRLDILSEAEAAALGGVSERQPAQPCRPYGRRGAACRTDPFLGAIRTPRRGRRCVLSFAVPGASPEDLELEDVREPRARSRRGPAGGRGRRRQLRRYPDDRRPLPGAAGLSLFPGAGGRRPG